MTLRYYIFWNYCHSFIYSKINPKLHYIFLELKITDLYKLVERAKEAKKSKEIVSIAYLGNIVDFWEKFAEENLCVDLGSDQTSLYNPWSGGYDTVWISFEDSKYNNAWKARIILRKSTRKFKKINRSN